MWFLRWLYLHVQGVGKWRFHEENHQAKKYKMIKVQPQQNSN
jgi:hypothetical protein